MILWLRDLPGSDMKIVGQLIIFFVGAALLLLVEYSVLPMLSPVSKDQLQKSIVVSDSVVERLRGTLTEQLNREPTRAQVEKSVSKYIDNEILVNEALLLGLHRVDPVVKTRALLNMEFVNGQGTEAELLARADQLGMYRSDVVIRRRLIERMKKIIVSEKVSSVNQQDMGVKQDIDQKLKIYLQDHQHRYRRSPALRIVHSYFSKAQYDDEAINVLYGRWKSGDFSDRELQQSAQQVLVKSDDYITYKQQERLFGKSVAEALTQAANDSEQLNVKKNEVLHRSVILPMLSRAGGYHFLKVIESRPAQSMVLEDIKDRVMKDFQIAEQDKKVRSTLVSLREEYDVRR